MEYDEEEQSRGQKRVATDAPEGEEEGFEREQGSDMHLGWLHEARGEHDDVGLRKEAWEVGHLLSITDGIHIGTKAMPITRAKERIQTHVEHVARAMADQQGMARYVLHRDMEDARIVSKHLGSEAT